MHVFVNGFEKSYSKAKEYFERAIKDNSNALFNLAEIYVNGYGVPKDYELAKHLYQIAAKSDNSYALLRLGDLYLTGDYYEKDYSEAKKYYEMAANLKNSVSYLYLGLFYMKGFCVAKKICKKQKKILNWQLFLIIQTCIFS